MHHAPAVTYPVGRSSFRACVSAALWLAGLSVVLAWGLSTADGRGMAVALSLCLVTGLLAIMDWWRSGGGQLAWLADGWQLRLGETLHHGAPLVVMDYQGCLLLLWESEQRRSWLWLDRRASPRYWDALRRAVYSRAIADAPPQQVATS